MRIQITAAAIKPVTSKTERPPSAQTQESPFGGLIKTLAAVLLAAVSGFAASAKDRPLALHPDNPHYFLWRGQPTVLITSAEHYGAVMNLDFDYVPYLNELEARKLNNTRVFSGAYVEPAGAFNITQNTLAPLPGRFITPWARSSQPGYANGGNKFDLTQWDENYFKRLRDFVKEAGRRGVVVEMNLFCPFYEESQWKLSPQNSSNNVNGLGNVARTDVYTLDKNGGLLAVQEAMTRKIVTELNAFDNLYFEICNEPYFGGVTEPWQRKIIDGLGAAQREVGCRKLISLNIANGSQRVDNPHPAVSLFNFHYCHPPVVVADNWHLNKPIGENETGFRGPQDFLYRTEGWDFMLAGGALYNNLDYSFSATHPAGTLSDYRSPGGGSLALRQQLGTLKQLIDGLPLPHIAPQPSDLVETSPELICSCLGKADEAYLLYVHRKIPKKLNQSALDQLHAPHAPVELSIGLPAGDYDVVRINPVSGERGQLPSLSVKDQRASLSLPDFHMDAALLLTKQP